MEVGPFLTVEQALMPQVAQPARRPDMFAWYNLLGAFAAAFGALASGAAPALGAAAGGGAMAGYHLMFLAYGLVGLAAALVALSLSPAVEAQRAHEGQAPSGRLSPEGRRTVRALSLLFAVDSFAGGMVIRTFTAFWFAVAFAPSVELLALVFFAANMLSGASFLVAARLTRRLGLVRTMVYTHLPSNLLLIAFPFSPNLEVAVALFLARMSMAQMDVAPRQLFVVTVVGPSERTAAAAITNTVRNVAQAGGPFALGAIAAATFLGAPFAVAGALKVAYDLALLRWFGSVPEPERGAP
jgi:predicted MFS family arabinose efflux permease